MTTHSPHPTHRGAKAGSPRLLRVALPVLATVAIVAPLGWLWQASRVPAVYSVMEMGYLDYGGGAVSDPGGGGHGGHMEGHVPGHNTAPSRLVTDMVADPARPADLGVELVTRQQTLTVDGRSIPGFTVSGTSPGPEIRALRHVVRQNLRNFVTSAQGLSSRRSNRGRRRYWLSSHECASRGTRRHPSGRCCFSTYARLASGVI
jgi:hypothetical protein